MQQATSTQLLVQPNRLFSFLDAATKSLTTDPEFGVGTMRDMATSVKGIGLDEIQFVTVPNEPYEPDPNRVQWKDSADQIWSALREDRPVGGRRSRRRHPPRPRRHRSPCPPTRSRCTWSTPPACRGWPARPRAALEVQGFAGVTTANGPVGPSGVTVEYTGDRAEEARTVAAAFPAPGSSRSAGSAAPCG